MARARAYIPLPERLASALADKLPDAVRDDLRARQVPADDVIALFTPDHIKLHAWGGADKWHNIDMRLRGPELKAKDGADTSRVAKANRIQRANEESARRILAKDRGERKPPSRWGKRKLQSRNTFQRKSAALASPSGGGR